MGCEAKVHRRCTLRRRLPPGHAKEHVAESRSMYVRGDPSVWFPSFWARGDWMNTVALPCAEYCYCVCVRVSRYWYKICVSEKNNDASCFWKWHTLFLFLVTFTAFLLSIFITFFSSKLCRSWFVHHIIQWWLARYGWVQKKGFG